MNRSLVLARKDLLLLFRNRAALFFAMGWPVLTAVLFGFAFSGDGETGKPRISVADLDAAPSGPTTAEVRARVAAARKVVLPGGRPQHAAEGTSAAVSRPEVVPPLKPLAADR